MFDRFMLVHLIFVFVVIFLLHVFHHAVWGTPENEETDAPPTIDTEEHAISAATTQEEGAILSKEELFTRVAETTTNPQETKILKEQEPVTASPSREIVLAPVLLSNNATTEIDRLEVRRQYVDTTMPDYLSPDQLKEQTERVTKDSTFMSAPSTTKSESSQDISNTAPPTDWAAINAMQF